MADVTARAGSSDECVFDTNGDNEAPQCEDLIKHSDSDAARLDPTPQAGSDGDASGGSDGDASGGSDGDASGGSDGEEAGEGDESNANAGWADAMAKILGKKTVEKKSTILVKNTELDKMKARERQEQLERKKQVDRRHVWEMLCREKPDVVKDRDTERVLQRIATRGVVQLFNAVRKHQKTMDHKLKEVGGSERKKAKILTSVSKKDFIDVLRGEEGAGQADKHAAPAAEEKPAWSVLREDYMMGATMKDWDKESDAEEVGLQA